MDSNQIIQIINHLHIIDYSYDLTGMDKLMVVYGLRGLKFDEGIFGDVLKDY